jgi:hypothetical protein
VVLPRLAFYHDKDGVHMVRTQFPLGPAECSTFHKKQGSTLTRCGLHLNDNEGWSPGSTYMGITRPTSVEGLFLLLPPNNPELRMRYGIRNPTIKNTVFRPWFTGQTPVEDVSLRNPELDFHPITDVDGDVVNLETEDGPVDVNEDVDYGRMNIDPPEFTRGNFWGVSWDDVAQPCEVPQPSTPSAQVSSEGIYEGPQVDEHMDFDQQAEYDQGDRNGNERGQ